MIGPSSHRMARALAVAALGVLSVAASLPGQSQDTVSHAGPSPCTACVGASRAGLAPRDGRAASDTIRQRSIEYSDLYYTSLKVHRIGSYLELPVFVAEYVVGQKLLKDERTVGTGRSSLRGPHAAIAAGLGVLFTVNTVTGVYNLIESRQEPAGKTRRWVHSIAMLVSDAGFLATAASAGSARRTDSGANTHRALAIGSMGLSMASTVMMWLWRN